MRRKDRGVTDLEARMACGYGFAYSSVIGEGMVGFIEDTEEKLRALLRFMEHQTGRADFAIPDAALRVVLAFRVVAGSFTARRRLLPLGP